MSRDTTTNRTGWNARSDGYQKDHGELLEQTAEAWGVWRIPEAEVNALGEVRDLDVLELGCGAAPWSRALQVRGARVVAMDLSDRQLDHARAWNHRAGSELRMIQADATALPFGDRTFDLVFCDHGAMTFAPPEETVPQVARVLRPGGRFVFCNSSPFHDLCWDEEGDETVNRLCADYFGLHRIDDGETVTFQLGYGDWVRLFRRNGLALEDLIELRPAEGASTSYGHYWTVDWARRWPAENLWVVTKAKRPGVS